MIERARVDVPRIVILGGVLKGLQLVAAGAGGQRLEVGALVEEAGDAVGLRIHRDPQVRILHGQAADLQIGGRRPCAGNDMKSGVAHRGHVLNVHQQAIRFGRLVAGKKFRGKNAPLRIEDRQRARNRGRHLNFKRHPTGALPRQRIEDEHRNSANHAGIHARREDSQCIAGDLIRCPSHLVIVALRIFVDDADARSGAQVVEIVEGDLLPCLGQCIGGVRLSIQPRQGGVLLGIQCPHGTLAHVAFVVGLRRHYAAMVFEVEFALPSRNTDLSFRRRGRRCVALGNRVIVPLR